MSDSVPCNIRVVFLSVINAYIQRRRIVIFLIAKLLKIQSRLPILYKTLQTYVPLRPVGLLRGQVQAQWPTFYLQFAP